MSARPRFGMSLEEIAKELGLDKDEVWKIERRAMTKLRRAMGLRFDGKRKQRRANP